MNTSVNTLCEKPAVRLQGAHFSSDLEKLAPWPDWAYQRSQIKEYIIKKVA